jgi:UDP-3-O-[3-hydroxymyristoyl] glucosamine N-acyltransferase
MKTQLDELAELVGGQLVGAEDTPIDDAATLRDAVSGDITFADNPRLAPQLAASKASAAVVCEGFPEGDKPLIIAADVRAAFAKIVAHYRPPATKYEPGVRPTAHVASTAQIGVDATILHGASIGENVTIGARTVIHPGVCVMDGCTIGEDSVIYANVVLYEHSEIGSRVLIHATTVVGAYGFGYQTVDGRHRLSAQLGNVVIQDDVEIGAGCTIDRGTYGPTLLGEGTKLDDQVMIAHNCLIGKHNILCAHVAIAGSTTTGDYVVMGGQSGARDHVHIGEGAQIGAQSGVSADIPSGQTYAGRPALPERRHLMAFAVYSKLPEMRKEMKRMSKLLAVLSRERPSRDAA